MGVSTRHRIARTVQAQLQRSSLVFYISLSLIRRLLLVLMVFLAGRLRFVAALGNIPESTRPLALNVVQRVNRG